jgi:stage IV sporulation protein B
VAVLCLHLIPADALAAELLIPGGQIIGVELLDNSVTVAAFDDVLGGNARDAGLCIGDDILKINGNIIDSTEDVRAALAGNSGQAELIVERGGAQHKLTVNPAVTGDGPKLGVYLRCGITGIGTVTYYDPQNRTFGALGHGVSTGKGTLANMTDGSVYPGQVRTVIPGEAGNPGQLKGTADPARPVGKLEKNTPQGVFGTGSAGWPGEPLPVAAYDEVHTGPATIRSTVEGNTVREYSVEILKIYPADRSDHRNFLIRVTDPALLAITGGIVQGMSGSPIIQDGKLVGAVTHVLVNDPTRGYGIFIENMLEAAE